MKAKLVFLVVGLIFSGFGSFMLHMNSEKINTWNYTVGKVIGHSINASSSANEDDTYFEKIAYSVEGKRFVGISQMSSSDPIEKGQQVNIYYNPHNPKEVLVDSWFRTYGFALIFLSIGLLLFVGAIVSFFSSFTSKSFRFNYHN
jgi:hypothetical protein